MSKRKSKSTTTNKTIFVTVGSTKFEQLIDRMLDDDILDILNKHSFSKIVMQIGNGKHKCKYLNEFLSNDDCVEFNLNNIEINAYKYKPNISEDMMSAHLVISHSGAGSIIESLEANKHLIVVVNETLMNNHQYELAERMQLDNYLLYCICSTLYETLEKYLLNSNNLLADYVKGKPELFGKHLDSICFCE